MMNLPVEDRDIIVFALRDVEGLSEQCRVLQQEINGVIGRFVRLINKQEEVAEVIAWLQSTYPKQAAAIIDVSASEIAWRSIDSPPPKGSYINLIGLDRSGNWSTPVTTRGDRISSRSGVDRWLDWDHSFPPTHWCAIVELPPVDPLERTRATGPQIDESKSPEAPSWLQDDLQFIVKKSLS